jgi:serralysin
MTSAAQNIAELLTGKQWPGTTITYSFLTDYAPYTAPGVIASGQFVPFSEAQKAATRDFFAYVQSFLNVQFVEIQQDSQNPNPIGVIAIGMRPLGGASTGVTDGGLTDSPSGGDIWLNSSRFGDGGTGNLFLNSILHEIGHALGLSHSTFDGGNSLAMEAQQNYTILSQVRDKYGTFEATKLQLYDISALQFLYGTAQDRNPDDTVYSFGSTETIESIWDTGGHDTFSAVDSASGVILNLNATAFSSVGFRSQFPKYDDAAPKNISIAKGTEIEDAIGSNSNDVIIGNELANSLEGRNGNDYIFGDEVVARNILIGEFPDGVVFDEALFQIGSYQTGGVSAQDDVDKVKGGDGDDYIYGGQGNDEITGGLGNDYLDGGPGTDIAFYDDSTQTVTVSRGGTAPQGARPDGNAPLFTVRRGNETDILHSIEEVRGGDGSTVVLFPDGKWRESLRIDGRGGTDTADFTGSITPVERATLQKVELENFENLILTSGADKIETSAINLKITLGAGNDTMFHAGRGSVVYGGSGTNTFVISDDVIIADAKPTDFITSRAGHVLHGAVGHIGSESPWVMGSDGVMYGINYQGDLVIREPLGRGAATMFVMHYHGGPGVPFDQLTAGIFVGLGQFSSSRLLDLTTPYNDNIPITFKLGNDIYFTHTGKTIFDQSYDPLVLDLNGDGVNLSPESAIAPMFDMKHTGFAVRTGWVQSDDGLLVHDLNANGQIDSASELFGGPGPTGFGALAQYDLNSDGVINSSDAIFTELQVWRDFEGNAAVDPGELFSLAELGIASAPATTS